MAKTQKFSFSEVRKVALAPSSGIDFRPFVVDGLMMVRNSGYLGELVRPLTPYIIEDYRFGLIERGWSRLCINLVETELRAGDFVVLNYGAVMQINEVSDDFMINSLLMVSPEMLRSILGERQPLSLLSSQGIMRMAPGDADRQMAARLWENVWLLTQQYGFQPLVLRHAVRTVIEFYEMVCQQNHEQEKKAVCAKSMLTRFVELVNKHCLSEHGTAFYAEQLFVTPHYLTLQIKKESGLTAKEWIDKALTTQAKVMLKGSDLQVAQIAHRLSFPNASFFSRFFKRMTGATPQEYRNS